MRNTFRNSLLLVAVAIIAAVPTYPARALTPEEDFAARCNAAGVIVCEGFDLAAAYIPQVSDTPGLHAPSGALPTAVMGFQDISVKASGASSLRFDILPSAPADVAGNFIAAFGQSFGQNSTFYVQFQQMMDTPMATFDWGTTGNGTAPKSAIFYGLAAGT